MIIEVTCPCCLPTNVYFDELPAEVVVRWKGNAQQKKITGQSAK